MDVVNPIGDQIDDLICRIGDPCLLHRIRLVSEPVEDRMKTLWKNGS